MNYKTFVFYNVIGGALWATGLNLAGFYLGSLIPEIDKYLVPIVAVIVVASVAPSFIHILKDPDHRKDILKLGKKMLIKIGL